MAYGRTTTRLRIAGSGGFDAILIHVVGHPTASFRKIGHILDDLGYPVKSTRLCGSHHNTQIGQLHWSSGRFDIGQVANLFRLFPFKVQSAAAQPDRSERPARTRSAPGGSIAPGAAGWPGR